MHATYRDKSDELHFRSWEASYTANDPRGPAIVESREITWQHDPAQPESYRFTAKNPSAPNASHNVYDLVVDDSSLFGRLYVVRALGQIYKVYSDQIQKNWRLAQHEVGLGLPNPEDKKNFERIYVAFCAAAVASQEAH